MLTDLPSGPGASVDERIEGGALILRVRESRLDTHTAPLLARRLATLIRSGHRRLALEMSSVQFIDSRGLSVLVSVEQRLGIHGGFVISSPSDAVISILRLTRLAKVFRIFPDEEEALAALNG